MTWEELRDLLVKLSADAKVIGLYGIDSVVLNLPPEEWFMSMRMANCLNIGRYEGDERQLVGTEEIPLPELTADFVEARVKQAMARQVRSMLDPEVVKNCLREIKKQADVHRDHDLG